MPRSNESTESVWEKFGGGGRLMLLALVFLAVTAFFRWRSSASVDALQQVADQYGLTASRSGQRCRVNGSIDGIGVGIETTIENSAGDSRWFTDFTLDAVGQPPGRMMNANLREKAIGAWQGSEWLSTGDADFDAVVMVAGDPAVMLAHLDAPARAAVTEATRAGWKLDDETWTLRNSGQISSAEKIASLLELGLAAARALDLDRSIAEALMDRAKNDPVPGVRSAAEAAAQNIHSGPLADTASDAGEPVTPENALEVLDEWYTPRSLEAAILLARRGDDRDEVRRRLCMALVTRDRMDEVIEALAKVGGQTELTPLRGVTGHYEEAAKQAIAAIEERL